MTSVRGAAAGADAPSPESRRTDAVAAPSEPAGAKAFAPTTAPPPGFDAKGAKPGLLRRLLGKLHIHGVLWYRLHFFGARRVPSWTYSFFVPLMTLFFYVVLRRIRRNIQRNFDVVLGPCGFFERQKRVLRNIYQYAWCLTERYEDLAARRDVVPEHVDPEHWERLQNSDGGFVLATAHIGHWEVASAYPTGLQERPIHIVREEEANPEAQEFFGELIEAKGGRRYTTHFAHSSPDLGPKLMLALRRGEIVALQGDRPARGGRTIEVQLFGRPFEVPAGPAAIARSAQVPILPVFAFRSGRSTSQVVFKAPIEVERTDDREGDLRRAMERVAADVEWAIRQRPYQWYCFRDMWPDEGEA